MAVEHVWFWYDNFLKELFLSYQRTLTILLTILLSHGLTNLRISLVILLHLSKVWKLRQSNQKLQQQRIQIFLILLRTFEKLKFFLISLSRFCLFYFDFFSLKKCFMSCTSASFEFLDKTRGLKAAFTFWPCRFSHLHVPWENTWQFWFTPGWRRKYSCSAAAITQGGTLGVNWFSQLLIFVTIS